MALFKDIYCSECGAKTNLLTRTKLSDGSYLCAKCTAMLPTYLKDSLAQCTLAEYRELKRYVEYSDRELSKLFHEHHSFHSIHLDSEHDLFYVDDYILKKPVYLKLENLEEFELVFAPEKIKDGTFSSSVKGKILLRLRMGRDEVPSFYYEDVIESNASVRAKKSFFGTKLEYENPKGMDEFQTFFRLAHCHALEEAIHRIENEYEEQESAAAEEPTASELQQAMALFMIDDLSGVTLAQVKEQRNRLIKMFHPDTGSDEDTRYAQKINAAYEVLKQYLS